MAFKDFDVEIQNLNESDPQHFNGAVATAGVPVLITPTNTRPITYAYIQNPGVGPNANATNRVILFSTDGVTYVALARNESIAIPGIFTTLYIDTSNNATNYEIIVWS